MADKKDIELMVYSMCGGKAHPIYTCSRPETFIKNTVACTDLADMLVNEEDKLRRFLANSTRPTGIGAFYATPLLPPLPEQRITGNNYPFLLAGEFEEEENLFEEAIAKATQYFMMAYRFSARGPNHTMCDTFGLMQILEQTSSAISAAMKKGEQSEAVVAWCGILAYAAGAPYQASVSKFCHAVMRGNDELAELYQSLLITLKEEKYEKASAISSRIKRITALDKSA
jgi:hypothetical protein